MGLKYNTYLDGGKIYGCKNCKTHLADHEEILSRVSRPSPQLSFSYPEQKRHTKQMKPRPLQAQGRGQHTHVTGRS